MGGAGNTVYALHMPDGKTEYITATDAPTLHVEQKQDWPEYRPAVLQAGFHAVARRPGDVSGDDTVGAINLYAGATRAWTTEASPPRVSLPISLRDT